MTLWKVKKCYFNYDNDVSEIAYVILPYDLKGHLKCCFEWYGIKGLKWCYLFEKQAKRKADKLNKQIKERF